MIRSRSSLATIEAAEIAGSIASPPTIGRAFQRHSGRRPAGVRLPSTSASPQSIPSASHRFAIASVIASIVAPKMLSRSMSSTSTTPMPNAQRARIAWSTLARRAGSIFFESSICFGRGLHSTTAAATTGPASGPRPASSTPATMDSGGQPAQKSEKGVPERMDMRISTIALSLSAAAIASCGHAQSGDSAASASGQTAGWHAIELPAGTPFKAEALGSFDNGWALKVEPGRGLLFITEKPGTMKVVAPKSGRILPVTGVPQVAVGGQGGLADFAFAPDYKPSPTISLSWSKAGEGKTRYGVVARGKLSCSAITACALQDLTEIWHQNAAFETGGQFALRITFAPDGKYLFVSSGEQMKGDPAQDTSNNLGSIERLNLDGTPAADNPLAGKAGASPDFWTYGHRNPKGRKFDLSGLLW